jgi:hypothetical protein
MLEYRWDICKGCTAILLSVPYFFLEHILPIVNATAALAGAFIAFHGVYKIIKNWLSERRKRNAINNK